MLPPPVPYRHSHYRQLPLVTKRRESFLHYRQLHYWLAGGALSKLVATYIWLFSNYLLIIIIFLYSLYFIIVINTLSYKLFQLCEFNIINIYYNQVIMFPIVRTICRYEISYIWSISLATKEKYWNCLYFNIIVTDSMHHRSSYPWFGALYTSFSSFAFFRLFFSLILLSLFMLGSSKIHSVINSGASDLFVTIIILKCVLEISKIKWLSISQFRIIRITHKMPLFMLNCWILTYYKSMNFFCLVTIAKFSCLDMKKKSFTKKIYFSNNFWSE